MKPSDLINFGNLSRLLAVNRASITRNRIPAKHRDSINRLLDAVEKWLNEREKK